MRLIISFLFLFILNTGVAQSNRALSEQKYLELQDKIRFSINGNYDEGLTFVKELLKSNNPEHRTFASAAGSYLYQLKGDSAKSDQSYAQALSYLKEIPE